MKGRIKTSTLLNFKLMKTYSVNSEIVQHLFSSIFTDGVNKDAIISIIIDNLDSDKINHILTINSFKEKYEGFDKGDIVRVPMIDYHIDDKFHIDVLEDLKLIPQIGYVYGIIYDDDTWSSQSFNRYAAQFKVRLVYHDENKKPILHDYTVNSLYLKKDKSDIDLFNNYYKELLRYGKD
jgi:hypothetical protein